MFRGEIWWANLPDPVGSEPGYRRPVLVMQHWWVPNKCLWCCRQYPFPKL